MTHDIRIVAMPPHSPHPRSLYRRLQWWLLVLAPLVWVSGALFSLHSARSEINELFDTQLIRLARQVHSTLPAHPPALPATSTAAPVADQGASELEDMSVAVWDKQGRLMLSDREGKALPWRPEASGFDNVLLGSDAWRVYTLQAPSGEWLVAVGQILAERDELILDLVFSQLLPWLLTLPVLLLVMAGAIRQTMAPVRHLSDDLARRAADDLSPLPVETLPAELQPLLRAMNTLLARVTQTLERERQFTADAAHELRTPLAALQAQWEAAGLENRGAAQAQPISAGLARLARLIDQMLALARLEPAQTLSHTEAIDWPRVVESAVGDVWAMAESGRVELEIVGLDAGGLEGGGQESKGSPQTPALQGDPTLLALLLRNLLDNAIRHSPAGSRVCLQFSPQGFVVRDEGQGVLAEYLPRLGDRFFRPPGQREGSGLGLSIVRRIADLHGLQVSWHNRPAPERPDGIGGFEVQVQMQV